MLRTVCVSVVACLVALCAVGCASVTRTNSLHAVEVVPRVEAGVLVELDISNQKVEGVAKSGGGMSMVSKKKGADKEALKQEAVTNALSQWNGDVLIGAIFYYEESKFETVVKVVGYPARYKSFRSKGSDSKVSVAAPVKSEEAIGASGE